MHYQSYLNLIYLFRYQTKQPLFGMEFVIIGELRRPKTEIEHKIRNMGGKVVSNVHRGIAAVISTQREVNEAGEMMRGAFTNQIQVIPEECIDEVMNNDLIEVFNRKNMNIEGKHVCKYCSVRSIGIDAKFI